MLCVLQSHGATTASGFLLKAHGELQHFSQKATAQNQADKYFAEGMADATMNAILHPDYDEQEATALKQTKRVSKQVLIKLAAQGLAPDVVARMRGLSGYAAYGYKRGVATLR